MTFTYHVDLPIQQVRPGDRWLSTEGSVFVSAVERFPDGTVRLHGGSDDGVLAASWTFSRHHTLDIERPT